MTEVVVGIVLTSRQRRCVLTEMRGKEDIHEYVEFRDYRLSMSRFHLKNMYILGAGMPDDALQGVPCQTFETELASAKRQLTLFGRHLVALRKAATAELARTVGSDVSTIVLQYLDRLDWASFLQKLTGPPVVVAVDSNDCDW